MKTKKQANAPYAADIEADVHGTAQDFTSDPISDHASDKVSGSVPDTAQGLKSDTATFQASGSISDKVLSSASNKTSNSAPVKAAVPASDMESGHDEYAAKEQNDKNNNLTATPYDDVFKTLMVKAGELRIPFLNEMFHEDPPIPENAEILTGGSEYLIDEDDSGTQKKVIPDNVIQVNNSTYHIECQAYTDGTILVRIFEYDITTGITNSSFDGKYHLIVNMPHSGILLLRGTEGTPETMRITIKTPGGNADYQVNVTKMSDYSLNDLIEKNLLFLMPFYIFNLEKYLSGSEEGKVGSREKVMTGVSDILTYLNDQYECEKLMADKYQLLVAMVRKVTDNISKKYDNTRKELDEIMGGKILDFPGEEMFIKGERKGKAEGRVEGKAEGKAEGKVYELVSLVYDRILDKEQAEERAERLYKIDRNTFEKMLENYVPDDELMQG